MRTIHSEWCSRRWWTLHTITQLCRAVSPPSSHGLMWWTSHQDGGRPQPGCSQPRPRAATARRSPSGMVRVLRPTSRGFGRGTAEVEHGSPAAVLQVFEPDQHVEVGSPTAACADVAVVEHVAADVGEGFGLPLRCAALIVAGEWLGLGVDHRGDRVEHRRVVEPALELAARAVRVAGQSQLVDQGGQAVVGCGRRPGPRLRPVRCPTPAAPTGCTRWTSPRAGPRRRPTPWG
jgi:hypothetical protein